MAVEFVLKNVDYLKTTIVPKFSAAQSEEVGFGDHEPADLHWAAYEALEGVGALYILVMLVDGEPQGHFVGVLSPLMHYRSKTALVSDMFYISKDYRARYAFRLFKEVDLLAKKLGADKVQIIYKVYRNIEPILRRLGYTDEERMASRKLR